MYVCMCMYVIYTYTYVYTYIHVYVYVYIYVCTRTHIDMHVTLLPTCAASELQLCRCRTSGARYAVLRQLLVVYFRVLGGPR